MVRYTFLTIKNEDVMDVPGEIVETYTTRPHAADQFAALVRLQESDSVPDGSSEEDTETVIDYDDVDGVGDSTAKNLAVKGYDTFSDVQEASTDELEEVDGVGPATAENIKEHVNNE